jgi:hypothetical protein
MSRLSPPLGMVRTLIESNAKARALASDPDAVGTLFAV